RAGARAARGGLAGTPSFSSRRPGGAARARRAARAARARGRRRRAARRSRSRGRPPPRVREQRDERDERVEQVDVNRARLQAPREERRRAEPANDGLEQQAFRGLFHFDRVVLAREERRARVRVIVRDEVLARAKRAPENLPERLAERERRVFVRG